MKRRSFCLAGAGACAIARAPSAFAQSRRPLIGYLNPLASSAAGVSISAFREGLRALGYVEGRNIFVEYRFADSDLTRLPHLAAELVALRPDVLVSFANGSPALRRLTTTIPIVMATSPDPVLAGLATSLARPGGNATGLTFFTTQLSSKRTQLLKEVLPGARRVGFMVVNPADPWHEELRESARALDIQPLFIATKGPPDFARAMQELVAARVDGMVMTDHGIFVGNAARVAELSKVHRLPVIVPADVVGLGFAVGYGVDFSELFQRAAGYVHRILKGANPAEMPIERPTRFRTVVNLRAAEELKLTIPHSLLLTADEVIS